MGLQAPIELEGLGSDKGYYRLSEVLWTIHEPLTARLRFNGYASQAAFDEGKQPIRELLRVVEADPSNPEDANVRILVTIRSMAYLEAKNIPELEGALDV